MAKAKEGEKGGIRVLSKNPPPTKPPPSPKPPTPQNKTQSQEKGKEWAFISQHTYNESAKMGSLTENTKAYVGGAEKTKAKKKRAIQQFDQIIRSNIRPSQV